MHQTVTALFSRIPYRPALRNFYSVLTFYSLSKLARWRHIQSICESCCSRKRCQLMWHLGDSIIVKTSGRKYSRDVIFGTSELPWATLVVVVRCRPVLKLDCCWLNRYRDMFARDRLTSFGRRTTDYATYAGNGWFAFTAFRLKRKTRSNFEAILYDVDFDKTCVHERKQQPIEAATKRTNAAVRQRWMRRLTAPVTTISLPLRNTCVRLWLAFAAASLRLRRCATGRRRAVELRLPKAPCVDCKAKCRNGVWACCYEIHRLSFVCCPSQS